MIISVEQKHIKHGVNASCRECPIALAVKEQMGIESTLVRSDEIVTSFMVQKLPRSAQRFIAAFDKHKPVKPFRFRLETA